MEIGILKRECGDEGTSEPVTRNGSIHLILPAEEDTIGGNLHPSPPAEKYENGTVEMIVEKAELGKTSSSFFGPVTYQDLKEIRSRCLAEGRLFEDPVFPATDCSLYYNKKFNGTITWLRPTEICEDPQFFVEGYSRFDVERGNLGDCWLLVAMANLTLHRKLFLQVVPDDQSFGEDYAGVFHFRIGYLLPRFADFRELLTVNLNNRISIARPDQQTGLISTHANSVTRVKYIEYKTSGRADKILLLRLRNPWGNDDEWTGPWSDKSPEWRNIPKSEKEELGLTFDHDGEFWISLQDLVNHFSRLQICHLIPCSLDPEECPEGCTKKWEMSVFEGEWITGVTAGGFGKYLETFWKNPQYIGTLKDFDEGDDENKCTV